MNPWSGNSANGSKAPPVGTILAKEKGTRTLFGLPGPEGGGLFFSGAGSPSGELFSSPDPGGGGSGKLFFDLKKFFSFV